MKISLSARLVGIALLSFAAVSCGDGLTTPPALDPELKILFVGNSLTTQNNLPGLVETIAAAGGRGIETTAIAKDQYSLEDHWNDGLADRIRELRPDLIVIQQNPGRLREHLLEWSARISGVADEIEADMALLMFAPESFSSLGLSGVQENHVAAASLVDGRVIPAGLAIEILTRTPGAEPYTNNRFHPSELGSIAAAALVVRTYFPGALSNLGRRLPSPAPGRPAVELTRSEASLVWSTVEQIATDWGY